MSRARPDRARDERLMRRAIAAAHGMLGRTWPNPVVGCVIAQGDDVLAEIATASGGRPHAEEQALGLAGARARGATAYISLEPCGERSSGAPSCSERLAAAGVARVVIAADNPDPRSAGRGVERLREAGTPVETGFLAAEAEPLYRAFRHKLATGLPLVEAARDGEGFDGAFAPEPGEGLQAALERLGRAGFTRLWTPEGSDLALKLKSLGFLH
ncbi:MAG: bifunctional diaminohydroxyphosphoribosylaminopyrimidine deaminase/5-amino-6-(5-phosphoribosylamino)uracil reductase RibD [Caulobacteraceae bacterium]